MLSLAERALKLIQIPSVIGHEKDICDFVEHWARNYFAPEQIQRINHSLVLGQLDVKKNNIALVGHLDTVPLAPPGNPPRIEGDRLFGLGSSDMKGALAVMMALAEQPGRHEWPINVMFVFYEREEGPFQESGLIEVLAQRPDLKQLNLAICMEPTDGAVQLGCVGSLHASLIFKGQAAHSARPWQGNNAIHKAGAVLNELYHRPRNEVMCDGLPFFEVMSATLAQGGRAKNVVPDTFSLNLNYRFAPGKSVAQAKQDVLDLVQQRCEVEFIDAAPSGAVCLSSPLCAELVTHTKQKPQAKQAWTDVARFSEINVNAINFGPGETAQAHQATESASVSALNTSYELLLKWLSEVEVSRGL
jgi:succinyl-diaminopimelate desuccinylase